ncbi:glycoside hydrolase family 6 protein [Streptomyces sp. B6B3]|uniref:glycoside hydrolase family 6 protein n=1 Tax=Streptomyces sp. B6B3 TaxID=3153570 RepID=UPI00325E48B2
MAVSALGTGGMLQGTANAAAVACSVDYTTNDWGSGFTANVSISNEGTTALDGWTLTYSYTGNQRLSGSGWNGVWSQSGRNVTVQGNGWNANIPAGRSASTGANFSYSGTNAAPTSFSVNGTVCGDEGGGPGDPGDPPGDRVDNPYVGAGVYVNPDWSAKAAAEPGGSAIADEPTAVWLDSIGAITGGSAGNSTGLADHLDNAVEQANGQPFVFQMVTYNLPGRDCAALASNGQLGPDEIDRYKNEFIDPIADILQEYSAAHPNLRIVNIIEIDSLPNLVTNVSPRETFTPECDEMKANGNYVEGVSYALSQFGAIGTVYNYVDAGHYGWIGWDDNLTASAQLFHQAATTNGASVDDVHGFIVNTANYGPTTEPYYTINDSINGTSVRQSDWVDWNRYVDNQSFALGFRQELISQGFDSGIGMLIDTSRNGWGGPDRPTGPGPQTDVNAYVEGSRLDGRFQAGNWCNQSGAGLGERPTAAPVSGIDAYAWIKPPGESDGASQYIENPEGKGFDRMCDPTYEGNPRNNYNMSGALPNAPLAGHWFSAQFQELLDNAYPPL